MLLEINGKRYPMVTAGEATLADLLAIKRQTGVGIKELQDVVAKFEGLSEKESAKVAEENPDDALLTFGVAVWLSRRGAGEIDITLEEACAVPLDQIRQIAEPGDNVEAAKPAAKKAAKKAATPDPS